MDLMTGLTVVLVLLTVILVVIGLVALLPTIDGWLSSRRQAQRAKAAGQGPISSDPLTMAPCSSKSTS
jgi:uncharacterized protein HemY